LAGVAGPTLFSRARLARLIAVLSLVPLSAGAHAIRLSRGDWSMSEGRVQAELTFHRAELRALVAPELDEDAADRALVSQLVDGVQVSASGRPCLAGTPQLHPVDGDGTAVKLEWRCPPEAHRWTVQMPLLADLSVGHTHLARASVQGVVVERIARATSPSFEVEAKPSVLAGAWRFLRLGIEHIFTGYDHLAFLLALLLLGGTFAELVRIISSFTVAHSVTLGLAALNIVVLPSSLVEPAIAASIVAVALENLWALRGGSGRGERVRAALRHRWRLTFVFGLVHGFGFASALRELELPRAALAAGLVSFNLGVEVGQLVLVALAIPMLRALARRRGFEPLGIRAVSLGIGAMGLFWLGQRLGGT
jgi:hydrogenase/urease accessory protein HupE